MEDYLMMAFLGINSWLDIRSRKVSLLSVAAFALLGVLHQCICRGEMQTALLGLLPGLFLILVSRATREALGMGDALLMCAAGIYMGPMAALDVLLGALLLAAVWAGILMIAAGKRKDYAFPFVPFLLLSFLGRWFLCAH